MKTILFTLFFITAIAGCNGCLHKMYAVHEKITYLDIVFVDTNIKSIDVLYYIDSIVSKDSNHYEVQSLINNVQLGKQDRVIYFKGFPEESYLLSCNANPCWIKGVFNEQINSSDWLYDRSQVSEEQITRIKDRFTKEFLSKINTTSH